MEISTHLHIENDFGASPVYSKNLAKPLVGSGVGGTGNVLIDNSTEGATAYLINGMSIAGTKAGIYDLTINGELYLRYQVFGALGLMTTFFPVLFYCLNRKIVVKSTDTTAIITVMFQFLMEGKKIKK